jgi:hypothetical protein
MNEEQESKPVSGTAGSVGAESAGNKASNKIAKLSMDQVYAEIEKYKRIVGEKDSLITDLTQRLDEANKVLESQERGKLIGDILPRSSFRMDELVGKSAEELKQILSTLDMAAPPKVNSVRFGVAAADVSDRELGLTVGDMSWSTAQKRKDS